MIKRAFDIVVAVTALALLSPLMLAIALAVRMSLGAPVLHRAKRPGLGERLFTMVKFRTMTTATDPEGRLLPDELRVTRVGNWLRSSSLDELPGLWNVLKGDMSIVGPRPLLVQYLALYSPEQRRRHSVRPGLTGWAQVNGRNAIDWEQKFALDLWYIQNQSIWLDLRVIFRTLKILIDRTDASAEGARAMPLFRGNLPANNDCEL